MVGVERERAARTAVLRTEAVLGRESGSFSFGAVIGIFPGQDDACDLDCSCRCSSVSRATQAAGAGVHAAWS